MQKKIYFAFDSERKDELKCPRCESSTSFELVGLYAYRVDSSPAGGVRTLQSDKLLCHCCGLISEYQGPLMASVIDVDLTGERI